MHPVKQVYVDPNISRRSLQKHRRFLSEQYVQEVVWNTPDEELIYEDESHFGIERLRKTDGRWGKAILWVHDRKELYWVGKIHVTTVTSTI